MKLNSGEIKTIFPAHNHVILKPIIDTNKTQTKSDVSLYTDTTYKPEHHARVICEVISLPKNLVYDKRYPELSMEWMCDNELKIGDKVIVKYIAALNAEKYYHLIDENKEKYYLVPYQQIYLYIRNNEVTMINGYVLVTTIKQNIESNLHLLPKDDDKYAIVRYCGTPNYEYFTGEYDDDIIDVGNKIILSYPSANYKRLENSLHMVFDKEQQYIVLQRHQISAVIK